MNPLRANENAFATEKVCGFGATGVNLPCFDASDGFLFVAVGIFSEDRF
jgi:hypothetical protein